MVIKRAKGAKVWDADDNQYLDCMLGFSTMILGNAPQFRGVLAPSGGAGVGLC
jgi:glutamate-1-semialdehyde aminotransferase